MCRRQRCRQTRARARFECLFDPCGPPFQRSWRNMIASGAADYPGNTLIATFGNAAKCAVALGERTASPSSAPSQASVCMRVSTDTKATRPRPNFVATPGVAPDAQRRCICYECAYSSAGVGARDSRTASAAATRSRRTAIPLVPPWRPTIGRRGRHSRWNRGTSQTDAAVAGPSRSLISTSSTRSPRSELAIRQPCSAFSRSLRADASSAPLGTVSIARVV